MPVQNSIHKIYARPDLATQLPQILIPTTRDSLAFQKGKFKLQPCLILYIQYPIVCKTDSVHTEGGVQGLSQDPSCLSFGQVVS